MRIPKWLFVIAGLSLGGCVAAQGETPSPEQDGGGPFVTEDLAIRFFDSAQEEVTRMRYGEAFSVTAVGLRPGAEVTLRSYLDGYEGWAVFEASDNGDVDSARDAPIDGTYNGVAPQGLVWSMERIANVQLETLNIRVTVESDGEVVESTLVRDWMNTGLIVEDLSVEDDGVFARVYRPQGDAVLPGVLVLGGSEGGLESAAFQASYLAGHGFVTMAMAYFDGPGLPEDLEAVPVETFKNGLDVLAARSDVDENRIGVMGGSRGGEAALMVGRRFPAVKAVVAHVPSGVRWASVLDANAAAWTWNDEALPYVPSVNVWPEEETLEDGTVAYRSTTTFHASLDAATDEELEAATIAVENISGSVLLLGGDDDGIWPSCRLAEIAMARLQASGHADEYDDEAICFEGAGHFGTVPGWPTTDSYASSFPINGYKFVFGGTPRGNALAAQEGSRRIISFFREAFE